MEPSSLGLPQLQIGERLARTTTLDDQLAVQQGIVQWRAWILPAREAHGWKAADVKLAVHREGACVAEDEEHVTHAVCLLSSKVWAREQRYVAASWVVCRLQMLALKRHWLRAREFLRIVILLHEQHAALLQGF